MAETNKRYASKRMKAKNPMQLDGVRQKVSTTLKSMGHRPIIQGGNGRGLTKPQRILLDRLVAQSSSWQAEYVVKTGQKRGSGYPFHYKIDLADPLKKIAVEVDGNTHSTLKVRAADAKKTELLNGLGWTVLRFSNSAIADSIDLVMSTISKC
jgi:hypothetical protein